MQQLQTHFAQGAASSLFAGLAPGTVSGNVALASGGAAF
jgi:hypothetical protein